MVAIIWMILIGFCIGAVAKFLMPGRDPGGIIVTILLGIAGSFTAGFVGRQLGWYTIESYPGFIASVLGAMLLLLLYRLLLRRRR